MAPNNSNFGVCTFNCRSVKSSLYEVFELCNMCSIVCIQEHWLLPFELSILNNIHPDFIAVGTSAVDISIKLSGRPFGGTAIFYRRSLSHVIEVIDTGCTRLSAVKLLTNIGPTLIISVYMPVDKGDAESLELYTDICAKVSALYSVHDVVNLIVAGDFNSPVGSRFNSCIMQYAGDNNLKLVDVDRLCDAYTYYSDIDNHASWLDHCLCSRALSDAVCDVKIGNEFVSSDHKPLIVEFGNIICSQTDEVKPKDSSYVKYVPDWLNTSDVCLSSYQQCLTGMLQGISIPVDLLMNYGADTELTTAIALIDSYYDRLITAIKTSSFTVIPAKAIGSFHSEFVIPGWNEIVSDSHSVARQAFLSWVACGKPRYGYEYEVMKRTRASFKLTLRYCRQHSEVLQADICVNNLQSRDYASFWREVKKINSGKTTKYASSVGGCCGDDDIIKMWKNHFEGIYNSIKDSSSEQIFSERAKVLKVKTQSTCPKLTIRDVSDAINRQKKGKAPGMDGVAMEALMFGGQSLCIHLCLLFNMFINYQYLPASFMNSVFIPLVKSKSGDLTDVNNYRAIAISNALSKLLESTLESFFNTNDDLDSYQFGFKKSHSTSLCTAVLKSAVDYYTRRGSHVFACFVDYNKAFDSVNYWKLFNKLLDNNIHVNIVTLLAYWYSNQLVCVRWLHNVSEYFKVGNGTRQGGVLSPRLFSIYISDLLHELTASHVGCNIGGRFYNVLAYADDIVLIAPSWYAMQRLLGILGAGSLTIDLTCNIKKTVCMVFPPKSRASIVANTFPELRVSGSSIKYVHQFKYLGHIINNKLSDDDDIDREIRSLFVRSHILLHKFSRCSPAVKLILFKSFCLCFYDIALWTSYSTTSIARMRSCYHKCLKIFFSYRRCYSVTMLLGELQLPSFDTLIVNSRHSLKQLISHSENKLVIDLLHSNYVSVF